jgi:hypothetical protein
MTTIPEKKLLILTTNPKAPTWRTLLRKLAFFDTILASGKNANFAPTELRYVAVTPKVINGRIDHAWLAELKQPYFSQGYDIIGLHTSMKQWRDWGIDPSLRGANPNRKNELEDFYFSADEHTLRNGLNRFEQVGGHELGHGYFDHSGEVDVVHAWHDTNPDISGLFKTFDWSRYQPGRMSLRRWRDALLNQVASLRKKEEPKPLHPIQTVPVKITQAYGVRSTRYKITGRHIGTDYGLPVGTPLHAPADGEVTTVGTHPLLGFFLHYTYTIEGKTWEERWCHLERLPLSGRFKRGAVIARSGNTGMSTGPHLHREKWYNDVRIDLINKTNWATLTVDPETHV